MTADLLRLRDRLSDRDQAVLSSLDTHRLLTTRQLQRLHFTQGHTGTASATRATTRVLGRLLGMRLVDRLDRRIGGVRRGSAGYVWQLGPVGERLQRLGRSDKRRRYVEPGDRYLAHSLAVSELAVRLQEASAAGRFELSRLDTEPDCWRSFLGQHAQTEWLKPDLFALTASGDFEDHWFIEADLATEHPPVIVRKCLSYQRYAATGAHQAAHGLYPLVLWVVPDHPRQAALQAAIKAAANLQPDLFKVVLQRDFLDAIAADLDVDPP